MSGDEKSKEWFLYSSVKEDLDTLTAVPRGDDPYDQYANMITVIEKSAYDRLKAENERLKKLLGEPGEGNRYRRLLMENERLKAHAEAMARSLYDADRRTPGQRKALAAYRKDFPK